MTNQEPASILLIDDHPMLRTGVKQLVSMAPDITVVGEASNGEQGIELAESLAGWWSSASQTMKKTWSPPSSGGQTAIC